MAWIQLTLEIPGDQTERFSEALMVVGAQAVTLTDNGDQPLLEPGPGETPQWNATRITGLFAANTDTDLLLVALQNALEQQQLPPLRMEPLEDKDWEREWMLHYKPMQFGANLWVCPSWCKPPQPDATILWLDPGLAFGTGTHPTTALCLSWLEGQPLANKSVIDYGCGSGILGVAAALLGCKSVAAVDIDPQALLATRANAERNHVSDKISLYSSAEFHPKTTTEAVATADVVVANILSGPLIQLAPQIAALVKPQGKLVLSGILAEQANQVQEAYQRWFEFDPILEQEGWIRISAHRHH